MLISLVVMPRHSPLMTRQNCKSSHGKMMYTEGERPDWEKMKVSMLLKNYVDFCFCVKTNRYPSMKFI